MEITINTNSETEIEKSTIKRYLQAIATNVTKENLQFLAELSAYKDINDKLLKKHKLIRFSLG